MLLCEGNGLLARMDPEECQRQLTRKQKNRAAAQRSRQRHTDKADTLHQQQESLEKHNHALRKEIQALQAEVAWWSRTLCLHQRLCPLESTSLSAPECRPGPPDCVGQPGLFGTPASSTLSPYVPPGLLTSLPSQSLSPTVIPAPPTQLSSSLVPPPSTACSSLLGAASELRALLPSPRALTAPLQPLGQEHPAEGKLESLPHSPLASLGLERLQIREHTQVPAFCSAGWQGLGVGPSPHPLPVFPLLTSAHTHF